MEIVLTAKEYCDFLKQIVFWPGGTNYRAQLPYNCLYHDINGVLWGDCVCVPKATIWSKATVPEKGKNCHTPGKYGLDDLTCEELIDACYDLSFDFSKTADGECLYLPGHIGTFVGDFAFRWNNKEWICNVVEATSDFEHGIIATYVDSRGVRSNGKGGEICGQWSKHGKLPWIDYGTPKIKEIDIEKDIDRLIINLK